MFGWSEVGGSPAPGFGEVDGGRAAASLFVTLESICIRNSYSYRNRQLLTLSCHASPSTAGGDGWPPVLPGP